MQAIRTLRSGIRVQHLYDEMTRDKRPQDIGRNGSTLRFTVVEHLGFGCYQDSIHIADQIGRCATYIAKDAFIEEVQRPRSDRLCGTDLRIETLGTELTRMMTTCLKRWPWITWCPRSICKATPACSVRPTSRRVRRTTKR